MKIEEYYRSWVALQIRHYCLCPWGVIAFYNNQKNNSEARTGQARNRLSNRRHHVLFHPLIIVVRRRVWSVVFFSEARTNVLGCPKFRMQSQLASVEARDQLAHSMVEPVRNKEL